jgi:hypothetical protein
MERQEHEGIIRESLESLRVKLPGRSEQELRAIVDEELAKLDAWRVQERLRQVLTEAGGKLLPPGRWSLTRPASKSSAEASRLEALRGVRRTVRS